MIQITRYGGPLGSFSEDEIREGLRSGKFLLTDTGWMEGMAEPLPLSQFPQFAAVQATGTPPPPPPPFTPAPEAAAPPPSFTPAALGAGSTSAAGMVHDGPGLPWENRATRGLFEAFFQTVILVLTKPMEAFDMMRKEGGLTDPLVYALIGGCAGSIVNVLFSFMFSSFGMMTHRNVATGFLLGMGGVLLRIIFAPFVVALGAFIGAGIVHLCLMVLGGANRPFETTFRVICFTSGSTNLLMMVPFCGGLIAGIWGLVVNCIGLQRAHNTDTWRAVLAVLLPGIVCCGGIILIAVFAGGVGVLTAMMAGHQ